MRIEHTMAVKNYYVRFLRFISRDPQPDGIALQSYQHIVNISGYKEFPYDCTYKLDLVPVNS